MSIAKSIDDTLFKKHQILEISLLFLILLFTFDWINEDKLITFYKWPNLGDNYFFPVFLISIALINFEKIHFTKSDKIIIFFLVYIFFLETFYFKQTNLILVKDLFCIFFAYKLFMNVQNLKKVLTYFAIFNLVIFFIFFTILILYNNYQIELPYINYLAISLKNFTLFKVFSLFVVCITFNKRLALALYTVSFLIIYFYRSKAGIFSFIIVVPIVISFISINLKHKYILVFLHFFLLTFFLSEKFYYEMRELNMSKQNYSRIIKFSKRNDESAIVEIEKKIFKDKASNTNSSQISIAHRFFHLKENNQRLKNNFIFGSGYQSLIQYKYKYIAKTFECGALHIVYAYGLIGIIFIIIYLVYFFKEYQNTLLKSKNIKYFFTVILLILFYLIGLPLFPAWMGLLWAILTLRLKNEKI